MVARQGSGCGEVTAERYTIRVFATEPVAPRTHAVGSPEDGTAVHCAAGAGACAAAVGGHVVLERFTAGERAVGTFSLTFADGRIEDGAFDAEWCPPIGEACP